MQKYLIEALGTFVFLFLTTYAFLEVPHNAFFVALVFAGAYAVLQLLFGTVSGAHFNPAVSLGAWIARMLSTHDLVPYFIAQCIGGIGSMFLLSFFRTGTEHEVLSLGETVFSGLPFWRVLLFEIVLTAGLTFAILLPRRFGVSPRVSALLAGCFLFLVYFFILPAIPGYIASLNPVRSIAPLVVAPNLEAAEQVWVYVLGAMIGGVGAGMVMRGIGK